MSTIAMTQNDYNGQKSKHIAIRFNMIRELLKQLKIAMEYLATGDMTWVHIDEAPRSEAVHTSIGGSYWA